MTDSRHHVWWVLAITGAAGFWIGTVGFPTWAIPVETAQVVAGIVRYPPDNPFYIYHTKLWTVVIQLCAVLLRAGISEITLSLAISGLLAMVSFQALGLVTYALGRNLTVAIAVPFVVVASRVADHGVVYPVMLLGTHHTYGALGLSVMVLAIGLLGAGQFRAGAFLLGVAPAVHPSIGMWFGAVVALALLADARRLRDDLRRALPFFVAGAVVTAASLAAQLLVIYDVPRVDAAITARYVQAFVQLWDDHRRPVHPLQMGVILNAMALVLSIVWLRVRRLDLEPSTAFLLRVAAISAVVGLLAGVVTWIPPERLPLTLVMLMPARVLNLNVMAFVPLAAGLLARSRSSWGQLVAVAMMAALLLVGPELHLRLLAGAAAAGLLRGTVPLLSPVPRYILPKRGTVPLFSPVPRYMVPKRGTVPLFLAVVTLGVALTAAVPLLRAYTPRSFFHDRTNDPFFAAIAAERQGLLVTAGSFQLVQLYTRRPVLIDSGGLDTMMYAPESGPAMERVLRDVYGILFFDPPKMPRGAVVPHDFCRYVWSEFSRDRWREIRKNYNVTQVVTRRNYVLDLPIAAENSYFKLYRIPD